MRRPEGTGFCCAMISLTLETAVGVSVTAVCGAVSTPGVVVEAIALSLNFFETSYIIQRLLLIPLVLCFRCRLRALGRTKPSPAALEKTWIYDLPTGL